MSKKITNREVQDRIDKSFGEDFVLISEYTNAKEKVKILHEKCGSISEVFVGNIRSNRKGCSQCSGKKKYTTKEIKERIYSETNGEYSLIGEYVNSHTPIEILHSVCGTINKQTPSNFLNHNKRCIRCTNEKNGIDNRKTNDDFIVEFNDVMGDEYTTLEEYVKRTEQIKVRHNTCGYEWMANPPSLLKGHGCPKCANILKLSNDEYKNRLFDKWEGEYVAIEEYINNDTPIEVLHTVCGRSWSVSPYHILSNNPTSCRHCADERKESIVATEYKKAMSEKFDVVMEREFPIATADTVLYPDIVIPSKKISIEVDGMQHIKMSSLFYKDIDSFKRRIYLDRKKDEWFLNNGYKVVRVGVGMVGNREKELSTIGRLIDEIETGKINNGVTFINYPNKKTWMVY